MNPKPSLCTGTRLEFLWQTGAGFAGVAPSPARHAARRSETYPRDGSATEIGEFENTGAREFTPPNPGEALDDAAKNFPPPGAR